MVMLTEAIKLTLFPAMMAFAASSDLFTMTIANRVSLILVGGFALLAAMTGMSAADALSHAGAAAAVFAVVFVFFTRGWIGGGDAKLAAATVLWLGFAHLADYLVYASLLGGALPAWRAANSSTGRAATARPTNTTAGFRATTGWRSGRKEPSLTSTRKTLWKATAA